MHPYCGNSKRVPEQQLRFYQGADCMAGKLAGDVIASGYAPPREERGPAFGVDGNTSTVWMSQCCPVENTERPLGFESVAPAVGCHSSHAWIGLDLGAGLSAQSIRCIRIFQAGFELMQSPSVHVSRWDGASWAHSWRMDGLGGSAWNRRPAAGNTMWRLMYMSRKDVPCPNQLSRIVERPWGVADLKFFSDDACEVLVSGGIPITSGGFDNYQPSTVDQPSYATSRMVDDDELTTWAANCRTGFYNVLTDYTNCTHAWVGMQWAGAHEIRCVSLVQSRWESGRCCDAADELLLQRWNGSYWVEASWFRDPPRPAVATATNVRQPAHLGAEFLNVGECPARGSEKRMFEETITETRTRKDSEKCIVKLTGAVTLLAEPYCIKHPRCVDVFGEEGSCCPIGDLIESESRCCCSFLNSEPIFADEIDLANPREKLSFEFATIWMSNILPWLGLAITIALYLATILFPADMEERARNWVKSDIGSSSRAVRRRLFCKRVLVIAGWPLLVWRTFLASSKTQTSKIVRWFILPDGRLPKPLELYRSLLFLVLGSLLSGMAPWLLLGAICGEMTIWLALQLCQVIRYFQSPFDPLDLRDMELRQEVSKVMVRNDDAMDTAYDIAAGVATTCVFGLAYFGKFMFDLLIVRAQMLSFEAIQDIDIENIEGDRVVELFPGFLESLREPAMLMYDLLFWASQLISLLLGNLVGIPLCEGSTSLVGSVALVMILYGASRWLNYDLFGLFVAAQQVVKATRPECQRVMAQSLILLCLSASFAAVQMTMVLFTRALAFANPFVASTWMCGYDDTLAIFVGRVLLSGSSVVGLIFVFLCVNGHFIGQDYITGRVAQFLGIDLAALDPDGTGDEGGMFRFHVFGAALPTLFGIWWDPWNINAYLVRERAHVYSMELRDPQACKHCDKIHVKYELMMKATARTISAAVQIVPYGAVVAKACEYLNDPPLIYIGNKMSCLKVPSIERYATRGSKNLIIKGYLFLAEVLAHSIDYGVPLLRRVTSVATLVYLMLGTFTLTEQNLVQQGTMVILAGFTLSFIKASLEKLVPSVLSYGMGGVYYALSRAEGVVSRKNEVPRTITGQTLSGAAASTLVAGSILAAGWGSMASAILVGSGVGYVFSILTLLVNVLFEQPSPDIDDPPTRNMFQLLMKLLYSLISGGALGIVAIYAGEAGLSAEGNASDAYEFQNSLGSRWNFRGSVGLGVFIVAVQFITFRLILVENLPPVVKTSVDPPYDWKESPTWVVLRTVQFFPGFTGIPTCTLVAVVLRDFLPSLLPFLSTIEQQFVMMGAGIALANISALTVHRLLGSFPQLLGFFSCILAACLLCPWNMLLGASTAVWIGVAVGSILEEVVLRRTLQREIKRRQALGEDDTMFFDHRRAACMEEWEKWEKSELPALPPEPGRQDKLNTYLQVAAAGGSAIEYAREVAAAQEQEALEQGEYHEADAAEDDALKIHDDGLLHIEERSIQGPLHVEAQGFSCWSFGWGPQKTT